MCGDTLSSDPWKRLAYNIAVAIFAYIAPLLTIFFAYFRILYVLQKRCDHRTFRFVKCHGGSARNRETHQSNTQLKSSSTKSFNHERGRNGGTTGGHSPVEGELNTHNMKTITRAKLKTLKLTALIGKNTTCSCERESVSYLDLIVVCFILCWTPYYCIVFFLLITDGRMDHDQAPGASANVTLTTPIDLSLYQEPSRDERSLLIVMMLAVSNSVLDPLIYGNLQKIAFLVHWILPIPICCLLSFFSGCYLVRPLKSSCWKRVRTQTEATTVKRAPVAGALLADKESKVSGTRPNTKNGGQALHAPAAQSELWNEAHRAKIFFRRISFDFSLCQYVAILLFIFVRHRRKRTENNLVVR